MLNDGRSVRVAVIGGVRIPFCRSHSIYTDCSNQDMMSEVLRGLVRKYDLKGQTLGDVALGAVIKHSRDWNLARECVIDSGLSIRTPGVDMQRACGTSIEAAIHIANKIALGQIEAGIAGGTDSVSDAPIVYPDGYRSVLLSAYRGRNIAQKILPWFRWMLGSIAQGESTMKNWLQQTEAINPLSAWISEFRPTQLGIGH